MATATAILLLGLAGAVCAQQIKYYPVEDTESALSRLLVGARVPTATAFGSPLDGVDFAPVTLQSARAAHAGIPGGPVDLNRPVIINHDGSVSRGSGLAMAADANAPAPLGNWFSADGSNFQRVGGFGSALNFNPVPYAVAAGTEEEEEPAQPQPRMAYFRIIMPEQQEQAEDPTIPLKTKTRAPNPIQPGVTPPPPPPPAVGLPQGSQFIPSSAEFAQLLSLLPPPPTAPPKPLLASTQPPPQTLLQTMTPTFRAAAPKSGRPAQPYDICRDDRQCPTGYSCAQSMCQPAPAVPQMTQYRPQAQAPVQTYPAQFRSRSTFPSASNYFGNTNTSPYTSNNYLRPSRNNYPRSSSNSFYQKPSGTNFYQNGGTRSGLNMGAFGSGYNGFSALGTAALNGFPSSNAVYPPAFPSFQNGLRRHQ